MSVLMRKPELVKRYCCVLQILDSSLDLINDEKLTPLHLAVRDNSVEIIEMLLAFGANTTIKDIRGNTGLHMATATRSSECLKILAENSSKDDLNVHNNFGITPLHIAMMNDDTACMDILLRYGANPKILDDLTKLNPTSSSPKDVKNNIVHNTVNSQKNVFIH
jgi:ankyrin repeat protein